MALLTLNQNELETIRLAVSILKAEMKKDALAMGSSYAPTPTCDEIGRKVNNALEEIQKDLDFESSVTTLEKITK